jgi:hypothetical protein
LLDVSRTSRLEARRGISSSALSVGESFGADDQRIVVFALTSSAVAPPRHDERARIPRRAS